uniref:G-protein coupled receptors family 2 profile 2 domain-containing protein n=1 Tax=Knipowitschia caucasica TaxID=637954 RepID=A0AAV2K8C7_KNICA
MLANGKMWTTGFHFLIGACVCFSTQLLPSSAESTQYVAELMVESNVTLEGQTILTILQNITGLKVQDGTTSYDVVINQTESVGECLVVGLETSCNCSEGYIWSNEVCYNYNCCRELTCNQNVSYLSPLCIPKVKIYVNGSVTMNEEEWASGHESILKSELERLNGYDSLNVTRSSSPVTFEVEYSVVFKTSTLQDVVDTLQTKLKAFISVQTLGMVEITPPPEEEVCYESYPYLKCTFGEATDRAGWNMSTTDKRFELNDGTVVKLNYYCTTREFPSCVAVTLQKVTGSWEGTYECGFSKGLVRHTAKAYLKVARLPDSILVTAEPITGDCSEKGSIESIPINVTATILNTTSSNTYKFTWKYNTMTGTAVSPHGDGKNLNYKFLVQMSCVKVPDAQIIFVQFENTLNQTKNSSVTVPVIYAGEKFCIEDSSNGDIWPKTPSGDTAVSTICPPGRVGYKERTCKGSVWEKVYDVCINEKLSEVSNAADDFLKGLGATEDVALDIFSELSTTSGGADGGDNIADVIASLYVLDVMAQASNVKMTEKVIPDLAKAASDMLNKTWEGKLIFVFNPLRKKVFMYFSSIVGYIIPILIVGSSYVYYRYTNKPYYGKETCWLTYERLLVGSLHSFLLPIGTILLSNIFSMTVVIVTLFKSSQNDSSKKDEKDTAKSIIKVILILAPVFGVTWSIGFYLVLYNRTDPLYEFFNYTFTIVNSFQGLFVLLTGFASEKKVKDELYKIVFGKKGSSDSTKNPTSTMYTKDK